MTPHNMLTHSKDENGKFIDHWICEYCKQDGTYDEVHSKECTHVYPPCDSCGQTPECAIDCSGVLGALQGAIDNPNINVTGLDPEPDNVIH